MPNSHIQLILSLGGIDIEPSNNQNEYYSEIAQLAEKGLFDLIYLDEVLSKNLNRSGQYFDSNVLASYLFQKTKHIGIATTVFTNLLEPYNTARTLTILDHFSKGRLAWYPAIKEEDPNSRPYANSFGLNPSQLLERKYEFIEAVKKLWESWEHDALLIDKQSGLFYDPDKVHQINHSGQYFQVRGPAPLPNPVQLHPVHLDFDPQSQQDLLIVDDTQSSNEKGQHTFITVTPILATTLTEAKQRLESVRLKISDEQFKKVVVGTPEMFVQWVISNNHRGLYIEFINIAEDLAYFVENITPLLQQQNVFKTAYELKPLREQLGLNKPISVLKEKSK